MHPPGWDGESGTFTVRLCVLAGSEAMIPALDWAIDTWNCRLAHRVNCPDCRTWEDLDDGDPAPAGDTLSVASILLHEVGHCAIGLGHPNQDEVLDTTAFPGPWRTGTCDVDSDGTCGDRSSFTEVGMATEILVGADGIRGTRDDEPLNQCGFIAPPPLAPWMAAPIPDPDEAAKLTCAARGNGGPCSGGGLVQCCPPCPGPACPTAPMQLQHLAWFRQADNRPFVIDGLVIDRNTYTRNPNFLPSGSTYAANANRRVGVALGYPGSQAVMYSGQTTGEGWNGLGADDVNMVKMAMTGVDRFANSPNPPDDYTLVLERVTDCAQADVEVFGQALPGSSLGGCVADIEEPSSVPPVFGLVLHYSIVASDPNPTPRIRLNTNLPNLDYRLPLPHIDFESGNLVKWSGGSAP